MSQTDQTVTDGDDVEFQLGVHDIDVSGSIADDENVLEFDYEAAAIFKRLADDIYESPEAGLREPLTNSITSCRRVMRAGQCDNPVITITAQDGDQPKVRLRDMGEGISQSVLENVLMYIGRSTARDDGELSGQYGMGFLASYKLVGMNGGFIMYTNPRNSSEGPYRGLFKPGAFERDTDGTIPPLLDDDEYGTVFEYFLKPDISMSNIRSWVENHAKFSPIPIIYKELDENGVEQYNEDYYSPTLKDAYDDSAPYLRVNTPYYEATTSPSADNDIVLISSPVGMYGTSALRKGLPWSVDLRIKYENGIVVNGPHEGLIPTTEKQYNMMDDERKERYVPKERLTKDDLTLPEATGTRERVRRHKKFLRHVNSQLREKFLDVVEDTLDSFNPSKEEMKELDEMGKNVLIRIFSHFDKDDEEYTMQDVADKLEDEYNYDNPSDELLEFIVTMTESISIISRPKYRNKYPRQNVHKLADSDSDIYMCTAVSSSWKAEAVELSQKETDIITVDSASDYESFSKHMGWTPLKEIKKSTASEMLDLSDELVDDLTSQSRTTKDNVDEKQLTVHHASGGRNTMKRTTNSLVSKYKKDEIGTKSMRYGDVLILFPQGGEHKVSDHYDLADQRCCVASCSKKVANYLMENAEGIMTYDEYKEWVGSHKLNTSKGTLTVDNIINSRANTVLTPKNGSFEDSIINDKIILNDIAEYLNKSVYKYNSNPIYGLIPVKLCEHISSVYESAEYDNITLHITTNKVSHLDFNRNYGDEVKMYCKVRLTDEQYDTSEVQAIVHTYSTVDESVVSMIDKLIKSYDINDGFASQDEKSDDIRMPKVSTKYGKMAFDEVYDYTNEDCVIIHTLKPENISIFEQDDILNSGGENLQGRLIDNINIPEMNNNPIYVPMLKSEYQRIEDEVHSDTIIINSGYKVNSVNIKNQYVYTAVKLPNWSEDEIPDRILRKNSFDRVKNIVDTFKKIHDNEM